ncbi:hypothetical protein RMATCC62417_08812 [Rhizopus microsporus]|nr:hypothetical protein RMATCC62417_08812 [Rhizopus microsporus]
MSEDSLSAILQPTDSFFIPTEPRSISFAVEEEDPWSTTSFDPVDDIRQPLTSSTTMELTEDITAANVLVGVDLPEIFDTAYIRAGPIGDRVSIESLETIIGLGGLGPRTYEQIAAIVIPAGAMYVTRNEFNTALALLACAQKNMDVSLMNIYQHRNDLPIPLLPNLELVSLKPNKSKQSSFEDDPWRLSTSPPTSNIFPVYEDNKVKQTNGQTKKVIEETSKDNKPIVTHDWFSDLDQITVTIAEKEGFIFPHINYWVQSHNRQSSVRRRYSDFYWFWETLMKRYPFRVIPSLPPKKFSGKDDAFLEKRCQGLSRFINCVVRHPVLKKDEVVSIFLTEETEFAAWRKGAHVPSSEEEFIRTNPNTEELDPYIPQDLDARIEAVRNRLPKSIEYYERLCCTMERMIQLKEARIQELKQYHTTLKELGVVEQTCFVPNCQACPHVVRGYESVGNYMDEESVIIQTELENSNVLESLKRHKDILESFLEMLERKSRLDINQLDSLKKKITMNTAKVNQHRGVPGLESEVERLDATIQSDTERMKYQQRKDVHIRYCVATELSYLHKQQAFVSLFYQNYVHEQLQFNRKTIDNWKALEALLCNLPKPEDLL